MTRPALRLIVGTSTPIPSGPLGCLIACTFLEEAEEDALDQLDAAPLGGLLAAVDRLRSVQAAKAAADLRLRRAEREAAGERWLEVAGA